MSYPDFLPPELCQPANKALATYLGQKSCHSDLLERVSAIVSSTGLGQCFQPQGWDYSWAVWHIDGHIFAFAHGQAIVGYLTEETDGDHPAGPHWQMQDIRDPEENLDRNIKNALRLVLID